MVVAVDSSGNGNDGLYNSVEGPHFANGCVSGDLALVSKAFDVDGATVTLPLVPTQWLDEWTIEAWVRGKPGGADPVTGNVYFAIGPDLAFGEGAGLSESIYVHLYSTIRLETGRGGSMWAVAEDMPNDGEPHHLVITYANPIETNGVGTPSPGSHLLEADVTIYLDGSALTLTTEGVLSKPEPGEEKVAATLGGISVSPDFDGILDEFAVYPTVLSSGDVSAHYAAATVSFAAYTAAVLANSPTVYYHLDDVGTAGLGWHIGVIGMTG